MDISFDRHSKTPIYLQIKNSIQEMILKGSLPMGYVMPAERKLAEQLGVNRTTVLNTYRALKEEGYLDSHVGQGTVVLPRKAAGIQEKVKVFPLSWNHLLSEQSRKSSDTAISGIMEMGSNDQVISFSAGMASPEFYPIRELVSSKELLEKFQHLPLQHTPVEGISSLRKAIENLVGENGIRAKEDEIMVLSGSQQGLDIIARTFLDPSDVVLVEEPTYIGALQVFQSIGVKVIGVPMEEGGMHLELLDALMMKHKPKLIYTIPTFQNPTGKVMDMAHRLKLLELSYTYGVPIIEDDAYGFLRMEGTDLPSLKALDRHDFVIYLNTFSKSIFPGLRIGYVIASSEVIRLFIRKKQVMDLHANTLGQWMLTDFIVKGKFKELLLRVTPQYKERRDAMLYALEKYAPQGVIWNKPEGGFYIWCELPKGIDVNRLLHRSAEKGVVFVPGDVFYTAPREVPSMRLNYTKHGTEEIEIGIRILMKLVGEAMNRKNDREANQIEINPIF